MTEHSEGTTATGTPTTFVTYRYKHGDYERSLRLSLAEARAFGEDFVGDRASKYQPSTPNPRGDLTLVINGLPFPINPPTAERTREIGREILRLADEAEAKG